MSLCQINQNDYLATMKVKFSIRRLFIAVALFAVLFSWVAYEWNVVQRRRNVNAALTKLHEDGIRIGALMAVDDNNITWIRRLLGDKSYGTTFIPDDAPKELIESAQAVFSIMTVF